MAQERDINLLPYEERALERFGSLQKKLSLASVVFLVATAIFTVITLIFYTSLASRRSKLIDEVEQSSATINSLKATEELVVVVKNKIGASDKIFAGRADYNNVFDKFSQLVPQGVYFTDIKFNAGKATLTGKARTSADVAGLVASLLSPSGTRIISKIAVDSLSSDDKGVYSFVASGQLVSNGTTD